MQIHGSLSENLHAAINSMIRLKGKRVYPDTVRYWQDLLRLARTRLAMADGRHGVVEFRLADQLEVMLGESFGRAGTGEELALNLPENQSLSPFVSTRNPPSSVDRPSIARAMSTAAHSLAQKIPQPAPAQDIG
jgi:hypothetical protein